MQCYEYNLVPQQESYHDYFTKGRNSLLPRNDEAGTPEYLISHTSKSLLFYLNTALCKVNLDWGGAL